MEAASQMNNKEKPDLQSCEISRSNSKISRSDCILLQVALGLCFDAIRCYLSFGSFFTKEKMLWFIFTLRTYCNSAMFNAKDSFIFFFLVIKI